MFATLRSRPVLVTTLAAATLLMITMGIRQTQGLWVAQLVANNGLDIATISLAMAVGQFTWGAAQPVAGALADRYGSGPVLAGGLLMMAAGCLLIPYVGSGLALTGAIGILLAMGSGSGSFSVLIGAAAQKLPETSRPQASGVINAGGSFGQFVFAPLVQRLLGTLGWVGAMWALAAVALAALPLVLRLRTRPHGTGPGAGATAPPQTAGSSAGSSAAASSPASAAAAPTAPGSLRQAVREAFRNPGYLLLHAGFFTCGFHIAFLVTHLPGEVDLCGLPASVASWSLAIIGLSNVAGSLYAGSAIARYRSKHVLSWMYGSRAVMVALYLMAPRTEWTFYIFAAGLGFTWLATVPPTASIVGKLFGPRYLGTLFGMTLLSHQIGGFLGAWLGGIALVRFGDYSWMWWADMALAAFAAVVNLPIKEPAPVRAGAPARA